jgi:LPXTG-site transpeptidase (sortase) family protein
MNKKLPGLPNGKSIHWWRALIVILFIAGTLFQPSTQAVEATPLASTLGAPTQIADLFEGDENSNPHDLTPIGTTLLFIATDRHGEGLFKTDPPYTQVVRVSDVQVKGDGINPDEIGVIGTTVFFSGTDGTHGIELWRSDAPYTSAVEVADINPEGDSFPKFFTSISNALFFQAKDDKTGFELWKTQPPYTSATQVVDLNPGSPGSNPAYLTNIGWILFFAANDSSGTDVWKSQPPYDAAHTTRVSKTFPGNDNDGHAAHLVVVENTLFFNATDGTSTSPTGVLLGFQLWKSTAPYTPDTTVEVNDLKATGFGSDPGEFQVLEDKLFFTATTPGSGKELHYTIPPYDTVHTYRVFDLAFGPADSNAEHFTIVGSKLFFSAVNINNNAFSTSNGYQIWRAGPPYHDEDPVATINPNGSSFPHNLKAIGTTVFFSATDGVYGYELYKTDPPYKFTSTTRVADINPGSKGSDPAHFTAIGTTLFFAATTEEYGRELWKMGTNIILPATGFAPNVVSPIPPQKADQAYQQLNTMTLEIPSLRVSTPLVGVPSDLGGWRLDWLWDQAGYLEGTAFPTLPGNSAITGHVYLPNGKPGPFVNLSTLKYNDQVIVHAWGQRYIYQVRSVLEVRPENISVISHEDLSWLTLVTCQDYDEANNSYSMRVAVRAVLVKVEAE